MKRTIIAGLLTLLAGAFTLLLAASIIYSCRSGGSPHTGPSASPQTTPTQTTHALSKQPRSSNEIASSARRLPHSSL